MAALGSGQASVVPRSDGMKVRASQAITAAQTAARRQPAREPWRCREALRHGRLGCGRCHLRTPKQARLTPGESVPGGKANGQ